jgi:hypothetical protein
MTTETVESMAASALVGLHLPADMWFLAAHVNDTFLDPLVTRFHQVQITPKQLRNFADYAMEMYALRRNLSGEYTYINLLMVLADLTRTRAQIRLGLLAVLQEALSIHLKTINDPDTLPYPRIISDELEDMRIPDISMVSVETMHRILVTEPWLTWMERLRAQKGRTGRVLDAFSVEEFRSAVVDTTGEIRNRLETSARKRQEFYDRRAAKKSIKRATKLYENAFGLNDLKTFFSSDKPGNELVINGHAYDWHLRQQYCSLFRFTTNLDTECTPVSTTIYNKAGEALCEACIYFKNTPIIDHILALKLNVSSEETEVDVLSAMNVLQTTTAFYSDPCLPELKGISKPASAPTIFINNIDAHIQSVASADGYTEVLAKTAAAFPKVLQAFCNIMHPGTHYFSTMKAVRYGIDVFCDPRSEHHLEALGGLEHLHQTHLDGRY